MALSPKTLSDLVVRRGSAEGVGKASLALLGAACLPQSTEQSRVKGGNG